MRHRVAGRKLNRNTKQRKALFKTTAAAFVRHGEITTTLPKAKSIQPIVEKLITKAKAGTLHSRRLIHSYFNNDEVTNRLVDTIAPQLSNRNSGFTKITQLGFRKGDSAMMAKLSFVDVIVNPEPVVKVKQAKPKATKKVTNKEQTK